VRLTDVGILYLVVGLACAIFIYRASHEVGMKALALSALAVPLWPLWAPIALTAAKGHGALPRQPLLGGVCPPSPMAARAARIEAALREGVDACAGTAFEPLLTREAANRIALEVRRAASRHGELELLLGRDGMGENEAQLRLQELAKAGGSARAIGTARLHLDNVRRLCALQARDAAMLDDLSDLVRALRTQLVLVRLTSPSSEGRGALRDGRPFAEDTFGIVSDMWSRVEGLGVALSEVELVSAPRAASSGCEPESP
jgi:hypothetical protein